MILVSSGKHWSATVIRTVKQETIFEIEHLFLNFETNYQISFISWQNFSLRY